MGTDVSGLRPFFSFYGAKWRLAPRYPEPISDVIIEPFAGSAGYSLRYPDRAIVLCDADPRIVATWRYLIRTSADEIRRLPIEIPDGGSVADLGLPDEPRWLIGWWLNKGMTAPCLTPSKWMRNPLPGRLVTYWGEGVRERIARQVDKIRHWRILEMSYVDIPNFDATWFVDPPYVGRVGNRYTYGSSAIDHEKLAGWCRERTGQVIVCEQFGADWLPFRPFHHAKAMNGPKRNGKSAEVIWLSQ